MVSLQTPSEATTPLGFEATAARREGRLGELALLDDLPRVEGRPYKKVWTTRKTVTELIRTSRSDSAVPILSGSEFVVMCSSLQPRRTLG